LGEPVSSTEKIIGHEGEAARVGGGGAKNKSKPRQRKSPDDRRSR